MRIKQIQWICQTCGSRALRRVRNRHKKQFEVSCWHINKCDVCSKKKEVTQVRDFGYPRF